MAWYMLGLEKQARYLLHTAPRGTLLFSFWFVVNRSFPWVTNWKTRCVELFEVKFEYLFKSSIDKLNISTKSNMQIISPYRFRGVLLHAI